MLSEKATTIWKNQEGDFLKFFFVAFSQYQNSIFIYLSELALLHSHARDSLNVLLSQMGLAILLALGQGHVERFGHNNTSIHLSHGLGGLLGAGKADKSKSFAATLFVHHLEVLIKIWNIGIWKRPDFVSCRKSGNNGNSYQHSKSMSGAWILFIILLGTNERLEYKV